MGPGTMVTQTASETETGSGRAPSPSVSEGVIRAKEGLGAYSRGGEVEVAVAKLLQRMTPEMST